MVYVSFLYNPLCVVDIFQKAYDGIRRRCLPLIYAALEPGTEDDRMKGALWTLNSSSFGERSRLVLPPKTDILFFQSNTPYLASLQCGHKNWFLILN